MAFITIIDNILFRYIDIYIYTYCYNNGKNDGYLVLIKKKSAAKKLARMARLAYYINNTWE